MRILTRCGWVHYPGARHSWVESMASASTGELGWLASPAEPSRIGEIPVQVEILVKLIVLVDQFPLWTERLLKLIERRYYSGVERLALGLAPRARVGRIVPVERRVPPCLQTVDLIDQVCGKPEVVVVDGIPVAAASRVVRGPEAKARSPIEEEPSAVWAACADSAPHAFPRVGDPIAGRGIPLTPLRAPRGMGR